MWKYRLHQAYQFLWYLVKAKSYRSLHSPLLFDLCSKVLTSTHQYKAIPGIEQCRRQNLGNRQKFVKTDYGAGSISKSGQTTSPAHIASSSVSPASKSLRTAHLAKLFGAKNILELGCSLGLNALYLAEINKDAQIITMEGDPHISRLARQNFEALGTQNISLHIGRFEERLPGFVDRQQFDFVYIDGDHRYLPTLQNLRSILPGLGTTAIVVLDDIHWSPQMSKAWNEIKQWPEFAYSIDIFTQGWLFKLPGTHKQDFIIRTQIL